MNTKTPMISRTSAPVEISALKDSPAGPSKSITSSVGAKSDGDRTTIPDTLPILPIRNSVIFPGLVMPLTVGRANSRKLLEESLAQTKIIGIFTQNDPAQEEPGPLDLHRVSVAAAVLKLI